MLLRNITYLLRKVRYIRIKEAPRFLFFFSFSFSFFKAIPNSILYKPNQNPDPDLQKNWDPEPLEKVDPMPKFTRKVKN